MAKTIAQRITINNILAFMIIGAYVAGWLFLVGYGVINTSSLDEAPLLILQLVQDLKEIIITMTIIVVLVVQFYFRTAPTPEVS